MATFTLLTLCRIKRFSASKPGLQSPVRPLSWVSEFFLEIWPVIFTLLSFKQAKKFGIFPQTVRYVLRAQSTKTRFISALRTAHFWDWIPRPVNQKFVPNLRGLLTRNENSNREHFFVGLFLWVPVLALADQCRNLEMRKDCQDNPLLIEAIS